MASRTLFQTSALSQQDIKNILTYAGARPKNYILGQGHFTLSANEWRKSSESELGIFRYELNTELGINEDQVFFADLSTDDPSNYNSNNFELINEGWNLISGAKCERNNTITFYIYDDAKPEVDIPITISYMVEKDEWSAEGGNI